MPLPNTLPIMSSGFDSIVIASVVLLPFQMNCTGFFRLKTYPCEFAMDSGRHLYANLLSVFSIQSRLLDALVTVARVFLWSWYSIIIVSPFLIVFNTEKGVSNA